MITDEPAAETALSTADLVNRATAQVSSLIRDELALARSEVQVKAKRASLAGGLLAAGLVFAQNGLALAWVLLVVVLDIVWPLWLAVLVAMLAAFALSGMCAMTGRRRLAKATPPIPSEAATSVAADLNVMRSAVKAGRDQ